jgi:hypothetical protein
MRTGALGGWNGRTGGWGPRAAAAGLRIGASGLLLLLLPACGGPGDPAATAGGGAPAAVFVSRDDGSDTAGDGSLATPYAGIPRALSAAAALGGAEVYVRADPGGYDTAAAPLHVPPGVSLLGGYDAAWALPPGARTVVRGAPTAVVFDRVDTDAAMVGFEVIGAACACPSDLHAVRVEGGAATLVLADVVLSAGDLSGGGPTPRVSYGLRVRDLAGLVVLDSRIQGGHGAPVAPPPTSTFTVLVSGPAPAGGDGAQSKGGAPAPTPLLLAADAGSGGGPGGDGAVDAGVPGSDGWSGGGRASPPVTGGTGGAGAHYTDTARLDARPGGAGGDGPDGTRGAGGDGFGRVDPDGLRPGGGDDGRPGTGGGGGGGGGGGAVGLTQLYPGGGGGAGGTGGRGGAGGAGGRGGDASVGVFLFNVGRAELAGNVIRAGDGGDGQPGGDGATGQPGGAGGAGWADGGDGGPGGSGGTGGGGGGGGGGPSYGVLVGTGVDLALSGNDIASGDGGAGADPGTTGPANPLGDRGGGGASYAVFDADPLDGLTPARDGANVLTPGTPGPGDATPGRAGSAGAVNF